MMTKHAYGVCRFRQLALMFNQISTYFARNRKCYKRGFTLAEILITLGIVGIVTALVLPSLITNVRNKILEVQFKVAYSKMDKIAGAFCEDYDVQAVLSTPVANYQSNNISTTLNTKFQKIAGGISSAEKYWHDRPDGIAYRVLTNSTWRISGSGSGYLPMEVEFIIDTNGTKRKPNLYGFDRFAFTLTNGKNCRFKPPGGDKYHSSLHQHGMYNADYVDCAMYPETCESRCDLKIYMSGSTGQYGYTTNCAYFAINGINPLDKTKEYFKSLPATMPRVPKN